jgi:hypothetical protein
MALALAGNALWWCATPTRAPPKHMFFVLSLCLCLCPSVSLSVSLLSFSPSLCFYLTIRVWYTGWLERMEPAIQAEHCRRLAAAAVLAEQEAQEQERSKAEARRAALAKAAAEAAAEAPPPRAPSIPTRDRSISAGGGGGATPAKERSPVHPFVPATSAEKPGVRVRAVPGGATPVGKSPEEVAEQSMQHEQWLLQHTTMGGSSGPATPEKTMPGGGGGGGGGLERPEWYRPSRSPQLLEEHRSMLEESTLHASRAFHNS